MLQVEQTVLLLQVEQPGMKPLQAPQVVVFSVKPEPQVRQVVREEHVRQLLRVVLQTWQRLLVLSVKPELQVQVPLDRPKLPVVLQAIQTDWLLQLVQPAINEVHRPQVVPFRTDPLAHDRHTLVEEHVRQFVREVAHV